MKKKLNVIQIKGTRGLILAAFVVCCLAAGFIVFPGWVCMLLWNKFALYTETVPNIGLVQGVLLWGILAVSYFVFRKEKVVVCVKSSEGLSEDELKNVFSDMKKHSLDDPILRAMLKAREAELKYKAQQDIEAKNIEEAETDSSKV